MKKVLLIAAVAVFGFSNVNAQETEAPAFGFEKGNIFVEGNLGYSSYKDNTEPVTTETNFNFSPKAGYFVTEDLAVGVELGIGSQKDKVELPGGDMEEKWTSFGAGVFARYYFLDLGKRFKTFGEVGVGFNGTKYDDGIDGTDDVKYNGFGAGLSLGINYFVKENIAITFGLADVLSYSSSKGDFDGAESQNQFNANINVFNNFFDAAQFGLMFKF